VARTHVKNGSHVGWGEACNAEPQHYPACALGFAALTPTYVGLILNFEIGSSQIARAIKSVNDFMKTIRTE
jgi:hypothetical protein